MKIPEHYKNLTLEQKRTVVVNLLFCYGNDRMKELVDGLWDDQVKFLFTYFFTESKEARERMRDDLQRQYEAALKDIENIAQKVQMLNLQYREFLSKQDDIKNFMKNK